MKLHTLLLTASLTLAGCSSLPPTPPPEKPSFQYSPLEELLGFRYEKGPVKPKIQLLIDYQRKQPAYPQDRPVSSYTQSFEIAGHTFGTKLCYNEERDFLIYFSFFADNFFISDYAGDGPDHGQLSLNKFHPTQGNRGNTPLFLIPHNHPYLPSLQGAILNLLVEQYQTGQVSPTALQAYESIKEKLLTNPGLLSLSASPSEKPD